MHGAGCHSGPSLCHSCILRNLVLELGRQDLSEICQELTWKVGMGPHVPVGADRVAFQCGFAGHVGPGLGAGGGSGRGGMRGCDSQATGAPTEAVRGL